MTHTRHEKIQPQHIYKTPKIIFLCIKHIHPNFCIINKKNIEIYIKNINHQHKISTTINPSNFSFTKKKNKEHTSIEKNENLQNHPLLPQKPNRNFKAKTSFSKGRRMRLRLVKVAPVVGLRRRTNWGLGGRRGRSRRGAGALGGEARRDDTNPLCSGRVVMATRKQHTRTAVAVTMRSG